MPLLAAINLRFTAEPTLRFLKSEYSALSRWGAFESQVISTIESSLGYSLALLLAADHTECVRIRTIRHDSRKGKRPALRGADAILGAFSRKLGSGQTRGEGSALVQAGVAACQF
jgi:hypothetical protein